MIYCGGTDFCLFFITVFLFARVFDLFYSSFDFMPYALIWCLAWLPPDSPAEPLGNKAFWTGIFRTHEINWISKRDHKTTTHQPFKILTFNTSNSLIRALSSKHVTSTMCQQHIIASHRALCFLLLDLSKMMQRSPGSSSDHCPWVQGLGVALGRGLVIMSNQQVVKRTSSHHIMLSCLIQDGLSPIIANQLSPKPPAKPTQTLTTNINSDTRRQIIPQSRHNKS